MTKLGDNLESWLSLGDDGMVSVEPRGRLGKLFILPERWGLPPVTPPSPAGSGCDKGGVKAPVLAGGYRGTRSHTFGDVIV